MKKIIILTIFLFSSIIYGDYKFSLKGGLNYSTVEIIQPVGVENIFDHDGIIKPYGIGIVFFVSWKRKINDDFYWSIDVGLNEKGYKDDLYYSIDTPLIFGYQINKMFTLYSGIHFALVLSTKGDRVNNDHGFLLGTEYRYKKILFDFRFQKGFGNIKQSSSEGPTSIYTNSLQFLFMIGYEI